MIEQARLADQEANAGDGPYLPFDDDIGEPCQLGVDVVALIRELKCGVISLTVAVDRLRERHQHRGCEALGQCLFGSCAPDPAVAIL